MLKIEGLSKTYSNGVKALDNVNLEIGSGMFGLLGPNGAGKSTLMRILATLQLPDKGSVEFHGSDVIAQPYEIRKILGYLPQEFGVYPSVSCISLLNHLAILKGISDKRTRFQVVNELLELTNLYDVRKESLGGFSGGMKQRFGIAQALLGNPELLIVDEPTAGLDPAENIRFYNLLSSISKDIVVILSTHIVNDIAVLCSNMAIINKGQVLQQGSPSQLMINLEGKIWEKTIPVEEKQHYEKNPGLVSFRLSSGKTFLRLLSINNPGEGFKQVIPELEDVYFVFVKGLTSNGAN